MRLCGILTQKSPSWIQEYSQTHHFAEMRVMGLFFCVIKKAAPAAAKSGKAKKPET